MESHMPQEHPSAGGFWSLMVGCGVLTAVCVHLAWRELDRPWAASP